MTTLRATANVQNAISEIRTVRSRAESILGSASDPINALECYLTWSLSSMRTLRSVLDGDSVRALIESTSFHLIHTVNAAVYSRPALGILVRGELEDRVKDLTELESSLRAEFLKWDMRGAITFEPSQHIGVLDTNVLMLYGNRLAEQDWNAWLDVRVGQSIALVIPQAVVQELDDLKRSNGKMRVGTELVEQRSLARQSLRFLEAAFPNQESVHDLRTARDARQEREVRSALRLFLQIEDLRHVPLADADAEIIDRGLSLAPFGVSVALVSADTSMRFRSEHAGLHAVAPLSFHSSEASE